MQQVFIQFVTPVQFQCHFDKTVIVIANYFDCLRSLKVTGCFLPIESSRLNLILVMNELAFRAVSNIATLIVQRAVRSSTFAPIESTNII